MQEMEFNVLQQELRVLVHAKQNPEDGVRAGVTRMTKNFNGAPNAFPVQMQEKNIQQTMVNHS